jgi:hypothetical protein
MTPREGGPVTFPTAIITFAVVIFLVQKAGNLI